MTKAVIGIFIVVVLLGVGGFLISVNKRQVQSTAPAVKTSQNEQLSSPTSTSLNETPETEVIAKNLEVPWAVAFLPDGKMLFTERLGRVSLLEIGQNLKLITQINEVKQIGEGGLLGIAVDPQYASNNYVYLYYTYGSAGNNSLNRVVRYVYKNEALSEAKTIVEAIPGAANHDGGRLKFGPDGFLYITTGDALEPSLSQDTSSLAGKILRVTRDGQGAAGNPFKTQVYSYGHRNPQGIAWDEKGRLWETEHGQSQNDEVNLIEAGKNYGWPIIQGNQTRSGMVSPKLFAQNETWAPSGMAFVDGSLYFGALRGQALFEAKINGDNLELSRHFNGQLGRIRESVLGSDGLLYITTNNRDGRGKPQEGDDQIIRVNIKLLKP